jgi:hypothetical protein
MSLTVCPDCQSPVSDQAPACPHCGGPIQAVQVKTQTATEKTSPARPATKTQTIEATGKKWKALQFIGIVLIIFAILSRSVVFSMEVLEPNGIISSLLWMDGIFAYLFGRVGGWWFHH